MLGGVPAFFDFLAKMGLTIRDDPPKTIDFTNRGWGTETNGFVLSAAAESQNISVVLRNISGGTRHLTVPEFSRWFEIHVENAELTPFGRELQTGISKATRHLNLAPGEAVHADIPIDALYRLNRNREYAVTASCSITVGTNVVSDTVKFSLK